MLAYASELQIAAGRQALIQLLDQVERFAAIFTEQAFEKNLKTMLV